MSWKFSVWCVTVVGMWHYEFVQTHRVSCLSLSRMSPKCRVWTSSSNSMLVYNPWTVINEVYVGEDRDSELFAWFAVNLKLLKLSTPVLV